MKPDTYSKEWMHQCLVRAVLKMRVDKGGEHTQEFLEKFELKARIKPGESLLRKDCATQWKLGNRGRDGDWRAAPAVQ